MRSKTCVEPLAVAARRRRGEAEQRARQGGVEDAELAQHAQVVVGGGVVALVVDDEADVAPAQHVARGAPRAASGSSRRAPWRRPARAARRARWRRRRRRRPSARSSLSRACVEQLLAVGEHQHLPPREPRQVREDHRLAGARGQVDEHPPHAGAARGEHGLDGVALVGTKIAGGARGQRGRHTFSSDCVNFG